MIHHSTTGSGFKGVMSYLETGHDKDKPERIEWKSSRNMVTDDLDVAPSVMRHTANQSVRCKKPVYHLSISWPEGDNVNRETMEKVADRTLKDVGLEDHQTLIVAHNDTDHKHIHMVVNRVHPDTGKAWATSHDRKRVMESLRAQEKEFGLQYVPNRLTDPEKELEATQTRGEGMRAKLNGDKPLKRLTRDQSKKLSGDLNETFSGSSNWKEFDNRLKDHGFKMKPKGRGYIVTNGETYTKFSSLGRQAKRADLEGKFKQTRKDFDAANKREKSKLQKIKDAVKQRRDQEEAEKELQKEMGQSRDFDP